jgi:hypothetical protein
MAENVEISKKTLGCLVGGLVASLMAVAFLFGRQSGTNEVLARQPLPSQQAQQTGLSGSSDDRPGRQSLSVSNAPSQPAVSAPAPAVQADPQPVSQTYVTHQTFPPPPTPSPASVPATPESKPANHPVASKPATVAAVAPHTQPVAPPSKGPSSDVSAYFNQLDALNLTLGAGSDSTQFATDLLQQSLNGDQHGFDELLAATRNNLNAVQAIHPPEVCKEHHRLVTRQLNQSIAMLSKVKSAMVAMDTGALTALSSQGQGMQKEAEMIQKLEKKLRLGL